MTTWSIAWDTVGCDPRGLIYRLTTGLLILVVLAGGICPALYAGQLPHDHVVVGGPAPLGWEQHGHLNPLLVFLGSPGPTPRTVVDSEDASAPLGDRLDTGRVVSLYSGSLSIVLSVVAVAAICALAGWLSPRVVAVPVAPLASRFPRRRAKVPPTPPPRSVSSSVTVWNQRAV